MSLKNPFTEKYFKSFDGTRIGYQVAGTGKKNLILCNGLGGTSIAWSPLVEAFGDEYRFITWDYRGLFSSAIPNDPQNMTFEHHVEDLEILLQKEKVKQAIVGGWSMGVQVTLEFYRRNPKFAQKILLINGTSGRPFDTALGTPLLGYVLPTLNRWAEKIVPKVQPYFSPLIEKVVEWEHVGKLLGATGITHSNINVPLIREVAKKMVTTNLGLMHRITDILSEHDATDVIQTIKQPLLIIAGTHDIITPLSVSEKMVELNKNAELFIVPGGTHYSLLEFPELMVERIQKFLEK